MPITCGTACTTSDVVTGLAQLSAQVQGLAAFLVVVAVLVVMLLTLQLVFLFGNVR